MLTKTINGPQIFVWLVAVLCVTSRPAEGQPVYQHAETRELVQRVADAAALVREKGEAAAFREFSRPGSRWRDQEAYIFVIDLAGNMLVHPDPALLGENQIGLKDVNGKPIIRGLIGAATSSPEKPEGWYHYEWPVPGGLLPRWKSSYVQLVQAPSGRKYVVGSGMNTDEMEKEFVVDAVVKAAADLERHGKAAFQRFHDRAGPYIFKDAYIFVVDMQGTDLVNPAFPNLEGRNILEVEDTRGKKLVREMIETVQTKGSGWVNYMWPKPGESDSTQKSAYVTKARLGNQTVVVGAGVYLAGAPTSVSHEPKVSAPELMALVRDAAEVFEREGEKAYPAFRKKGSKWFHGETYFYVWSLSGTRVFYAADPALEGDDVRNLTDVVGKPIGKMFPEAVSGPSGEGWVHYMWPEPNDIFPQWKSSFLKRVTFPSGEQYLIGCGIYNMEMDRAFIEDVVNKAAALVAAEGKAAFPALRDKTGPFVFMDTYVRKVRHGADSYIVGSGFYLREEARKEFGKRGAP